jgi:hypothetical protein
MKKCCCRCCGRKPAIHFRVELVPAGDQPAGPFYVHVKRKDSKMSFIIPIGQKAKLSISPRDAAGNPSEIEGVPVWSTSDPAIATVTADPADPDGLTAFAVPVGPLGTAQAHVSVDADLGEGVTTVEGVLDIEVKAGETVSVNIDAALEPV